MISAGGLRNEVEATRVVQGRAMMIKVRTC